jgi:hypothetical protein
MGHREMKNPTGGITDALHRDSGVSVGPKQTVGKTKSPSYLIVEKARLIIVISTKSVIAPSWVV